MSLPKYFDDLKVGICAITGEPRIFKENKKTPGVSDKYKKIDIKEWTGILLSYFSFHKIPVFSVASNGIFYMGGKAETKEQIIEYAEKFIEKVKEMEIPEEIKK